MEADGTRMENSIRNLSLTGGNLAIEDVHQVARNRRAVEPLDDEICHAMEASQGWVEEAVRAGDVIYGVTTGFGPLATTSIAPDEARQLSRNLVLNCLAGVGDPLPEDVVRAMMLVRANSLAKGLSGVRPVVVGTLIEMLNRGVVPFVPEKGSLGASGDLAPLAHIAVVLSRDLDGEGYSGEAWYRSERMSGSAAMEAAGIPRIVLEAKEGLALTNGTTFMAVAGALGVYDARRLLEQAELAAAVSFEALLAITAALDPDLQNANGQPGQARTAERLLEHLGGSGLVDSAPGKVQDAYSLRCTPQVLGPVHDALDFIEARFAACINAASDNPLIFLDPDGGRAVSGGNFHGGGPAMWLDFLGIAVAEVGSISERRTFRMLDPALNGGLPSMLVTRSGLDSGLMIPQYTAAALVSDNKTLAHPDSVDSIPSSANQEDHVSMGANAARHALEILSNVRKIIAIELITAAQAVDLRPDGPARLGKGTREAYRKVRSLVAFLEHDRATSPDIEAVERMLENGEL
jgi:histidine ammonia-lyase